jgi:signal transduction histidine kinase
MVAHEINNPLSGILSYAKVSSRYLGRENIDSEILESVKQNLTFIGNETKRCGNIVKNLLIFARKTSGDFKEEHLNIIIDNSIKVIEHSVKMKELALVMELDQENDLIQCDAGGIQQVLVALIVNSIEATSRGGKITIKTDGQTEKDRIRIIVIDDGKGIPEDVLPHIFEPFLSTKVKSTGLGLSVVYGIVEQHTGTIDVTDAYVQIAENHHRERPGNRGGCHNKHVRTEPFPHERLALQHSEAVLLIYDRKSEVLELYTPLEQGMGADGDGNGSFRNPFEQRLLVPKTDTSSQKHRLNA